MARGKLSGNDVEAKVAVMAALRKAKGRRPIRQFIAALRDPELPVAKTAAMGLCDRKAIVAPLRELLGDPDPAMRWRACSLAWFFMVKDFVPELIEVLAGDGDVMVRAEAAWAMRCADSDAGARALLKATKDADRMVAHYAAWTLGRILKVKHPRLRSLRGARIPQRPLLPERRGRKVRPAPPAIDDARAFEQLACWVRQPVYRAPLAAAAAKVDGDRDRRYARAAAASLVHIDGYPEPPLRKTDFRVVSSPRGLHFHVRCQYRGKAELAARHTAYGSPVHADNSIEIFLDPSGTGSGRYFQICLNTRNARCDVLRGFPPGHTWRPAGEGGEDRWRPKGIRTAVRVGKGCWNAELAVPFAELGLSAGRINKLWRMNVIRNAHLPQRGETTSWCDLGDYDAHRPERFGYLWVDAGSVVNADASIFQTLPLPLRPGLKGWTVLGGDCRVRDGEAAAPSGRGVLRWDRPIPFEEFEVAAQAQVRHQIRFLFSPDRPNAGVAFMAAYINPINEINIAGMRRWEHWAPPYPGHLSIFKEVYPRLTHSRWYDVAVRVRKDRLQCLLDGAVHMELPNPRPEVRYFGLALLGGGKVRKLRFRPLGPGGKGRT